ncbi:MAG: hypothetical protein HOV81_22745, partial [Kofleriaceae bacterium]|nr:hypothetical protein [Kofleriaceae bacterium]
MWRRLCLSAALLIASGCSQILGIEDFHLVDAGFEDAPIDAQQCFGTSLATVCLTTLPVDPFVATGAIDTAGMACTQVVAQTGGPELCVIAATQITIDAASTITATGARPLVFVATDTITIAGTLDVSSKRSPARVGAGGNSSACTASANGTGNANGGGGGGGGS